MEADEPIIVESGSPPPGPNPLSGTITLARLREELRRRFPPGSERRHLPEVEEAAMVRVPAAVWRRLEALAAGHGLPPTAGQLARTLIAWALEQVEGMTPEAVKELVAGDARPGAGA